MTMFDECLKTIASVEYSLEAAFDLNSVMENELKGAEISSGHTYCNSDKSSKMQSESYEPGCLQ